MVRTSEYLPSVVGLLFCWTVVAIVAATTSFIGLGGTTIGEWATIAGYMFVFFYAWIPVSVSVFLLVRWLTRNHVNRITQVVIHLSYLAVITTSLAVIVHPQTWPDWLYGQHAVGFHSLNGFIYSVTVICSVVICHYAWLRSREEAAREARQREAALEHALTQSQMEALRAQVNPHFLFNTLNSVASLVHSSANDKAYGVVENLASLLRYALDVSGENLVTLEDEISFLEAYIDIEQVRYGSRLQFETVIDPKCLDVLVPALSLQPLVENSIKHAVAKSKQATTIRLSAHAEPGTLKIVVSDDGPGLAEPVKEGVGLANVRKRLLHLFGDTAQFLLRGGADRGVSATLSIPLDGRGQLHSAVAARRYEDVVSKSLPSAPVTGTNQDSSRGTLVS